MSEGGDAAMSRRRSVGSVGKVSEEGPVSVAGVGVSVSSEPAAAGDGGDRATGGVGGRDTPDRPYSNFGDYQQARMPVKSMTQAIVKPLSSLSDKGCRDYFPPFKWLRTYKGGKLAKDAVAGITVAVMLIPQSLAYSVLAGTPPIYGLYSSTIPLLLYALFASSTKLSVGPVATTSILVSSSIAAMEPRDEAHAIQLTIALTFVAGIVQILMGLLRGGVIANLLSWPVMDGFVSAAAFIIVASQMKELLGLDIEKDSFFFGQLVKIGVGLPTANIPTVILGVLSIAAFLGIKIPKNIPKWVPMQLFVVIATMLASWAFDLQGHGVRVVGAIPKGFPEFGFPVQSLQEVLDLIPSAIVLSFVSYVGAISLALAFGAEAGEKVDSDQELIALGAGCLGGSFFQSITISGSFTRTAINADVGAVSPLGCGITGVCMVIVLLFLAPLFELLPKAVLAGMIIASVKKLVKIQAAKQMWRAGRGDFWQFAVSFCAVLGLGIDNGIVAAVVFSLSALVYKSFTPRIREVGHLPDRPDVYVDTRRFPNAVKSDGVVVIRVHSSLHFGNVKRVMMRLQDILVDGGAVRIDERDASETVFTQEPADAAPTSAEVESELRRAESLREGTKPVPGREATDPVASGSVGAAPADDDIERKAADAHGGSNSSLGSVDSKVALATSSSAKLKAVVIDCARIVSVDGTAVRELGKVLETYTEHGVKLLFASAPGRTRDTMRKYELFKDREHFEDAMFLSIVGAVNSVVPPHRQFDVRASSRALLDGVHLTPLLEGVPSPRGDAPLPTGAGGAGAGAGGGVTAVDDAAPTAGGKGGKHD